MSGPNDLQAVSKMFGMPMGGAKGPLPTMPLGMTKKRMGDERVPMSRERPQRNPGQVQDEAARRLGVRPEQVTASPSAPQSPPAQAPRPGVASVPPPRAQPPVQASPQAPALAAPPPTLPREENPSPVSGIPMPRSRPGAMDQLGSDVGNMLAQLPGGSPQGAAVAQVLGDKVQGRPGFSSAQAAPAPRSPFEGGAPPVQAGPMEMLAKVMAAAKLQAQSNAPPKPPQQAPSATVTPPVPPNAPIPPPPAVQDQGNYTPSQPSFQGYTIRPSAKETKGEEKHSGDKALKKENNPYYYTRIGVRPGDNAGVAQRLREVRAKAEDPRQAKKMTPEEDRILAQYNEKDAYLMSMLPEDVARRMQQYRSGTLTTQIPDRYSERPPGAPEGNQGTALKLPPKSVQKMKVDPAEEQVKDIIDNPPPKNATDAETPYTLRED
jgi:hypothetical protein